MVLGCHYTALRLQNRVVSRVSFLTEGVFECDFAYRRSVAVLCMLYKIRRNPMDTPSLWGSSSAICAGAGYVRRGDSISVHEVLAAEPRSIAGLLFPCQYLCGTISVTPYSMVWDWRVSRAWPMNFYWPSCSLTFCLLLFSLSLLSLHGLVLWGWSLRTDRVLIALPTMLYNPLESIIIK